MEYITEIKIQISISTNKSNRDIDLIFNQDNESLEVFRDTVIDELKKIINNESE